MTCTVCTHTYMYLHVCIGYSTASLVPHACMHILHVARPAICHAITNLLYGAACPSLLPSSTMGQIDLLVSHDTHVFGGFFRVKKILDLRTVHVVSQA